MTPMVDGPLRVMWVCSPLLPVGGGFQHLRLWSRYLDRDAFEISLVYSSPHPAAVEAGLTAEGRLRCVERPELRSARSLYLPALRALRRVMASERPHVVHSIFVQSDVLASLATPAVARPARLSSAFGYLTARTGSKRLIYAAAYRVALKRIDLVTAISEATSRELRRDFGVPERKLRLMRSGIDAGRLAAYRDDEARDQDHVVLAAQLIRVKGVDVFLDALASLRSAHPRLRASIAGDGPERLALEARARSLGIFDRVRFLGEIADVPALLGRASILVAAARPGFDGVPRVVLEAMACGAAVVSTTAGGIAEVVRDGVDGLLVGSPTASRIADAVSRLLSDPALAQRLRDHAAQRIWSFDVRREVEQLSDIYRELAGKKAA